MNATKAARKPRKIIPHSDQWERLANQVARDFCPSIYPCADCGGPVVSGYCCTRCGSDYPERRGREDS